MLRYHNITTDDMKNGEGLRTVLWLAGCNHHCKNCHNPQTWDPYGGLPFNSDVEKELLQKLKPDYISGLTLSGGDPLYEENREELHKFFTRLFMFHGDVIKNKTVWLYTGYTWEELLTEDDLKPDTIYLSEMYKILSFVDVLVDGRYEDSLSSKIYPWAGSINQRVIDVKKSMKKREVVLYECN